MVLEGKEWREKDVRGRERDVRGRGRERERKGSAGEIGLTHH